MSRVKDEHAGHNHVLGNISEDLKEFNQQLEAKFPKIRYTSGKRTASQGVGKYSKTSLHNTGNAEDIGAEHKDVYEWLTKNEEGIALAANYGIKIIDETNEATMKKTGATGKHYHFETKGRPQKTEYVPQVVTPTQNPEEQNTFDIEAFKRDIQKEKEKEELLKQKELESLAMQDIEAKKQAKAEFLKAAIRERENNFKTTTEGTEEDYVEPQRDYSFLQQRNPANSSSPLFSTGQELS